MGLKHIAGPIQSKSNEYSGTAITIKSEAPEAFEISRKLCMGEMKDICEREGNKLHASSSDDAARNRTGRWLNETPASCPMKRRTCTIGIIEDT